MTDVARFVWSDADIEHDEGKGDTPGHEFHGNQYTGGQGAAAAPTSMFGFAPDTPGRAVERWVAEGAPNVKGKELAALKKAVDASPPAPQDLARGFAVPEATAAQLRALKPGDTYELGAYLGNGVEGFTTETGVAAGWANQARGAYPDGSRDTPVVLELQSGFGHALPVSKYVDLGQASEDEWIVGGAVPVAGTYTDDNEALHVLLGDRSHPSMDYATKAWSQEWWFKGDTPGHEFHGNQYTGGRGATLAESSMVEALREPDGGFTIDPRDGSTPTTGYAVAMPGHESITPVDEFFAGPEGQEAGVKIIHDWLAKNAAVFDDPNVKVGGWHDPSHHEIALDPTVVIQDRAEAVAAGIANNQQKIADLAAIHAGDWDHAMIDTYGTGNRST